MRLCKWTLLLGAVGASLALGPVYGAGSKDKDPGFNALDKNKDGYLSRTEAARNPELLKRFRQADKNGDRKLSRTEYLTVMTKKDFNSVKEKLSNLVHKDKGASASAGSSKAKQ